MGNLWDSFIEGYNSAGPEPQGEGSAWDSLMSGSKPTQQRGNTFTAQSRGTAQTKYAGSGKVDRDYVINGLMKRGLPEHVAVGFAMNMEDESGLNPGINEIEPLVEGSRGGYGLYQLTGPRRRQYEAYADSIGVNYADPDAQMDFLMWELENTEKGAASNIMNTSTAGEAGAAIVNDFLRPAKKHREKRASKYLGGGATTQKPPSPNRLWLDF